ncbi:MAG: SusC/RagA family TonB-linked outer membrane protein [Sphingobacteriales bacterium]|nr:SusC/RagA family TonB-linked outer membrane protein [Sphingobacteriales bacterium]OJW01964.1 MAG: hypothetical protein BGO52_00330 [Sphingobacteriales bacterium 44-61]
MLAASPAIPVMPVIRAAHVDAIGEDCFIVQPKLFKCMKIEAYYARVFLRAPITKTLMIMKLTAILVFAACLQVSAAGFSQTITLSLKKAPLKQVFAEITKQTGYHFVYTDSVLSVAPAIDIAVKDADIKQALAACFKDLPLTYQLNDTYIVVAIKQQKLSLDHPPGDLRGRVVNEKGEPVISATVNVKGTMKGTTTNEDGVFVLRGIKENDLLIISSVGFERQELRLRGQTEIIIRLKVSSSRLDSVNIFYNTGYQFIPKERATGSFVQIDRELLNRSVSTNLLERLQDVTSGMLSQGRNTNSPINDISIRGVSTFPSYSDSKPLIVLDNFEYEGDIRNINPNDIESITVLKDAAAASIWGAKSANGVIVITSKSGRVNERTKVSFNSNVTIGEKPDLYYQPLMSIGDYVDVEKFLFQNGYYNSRITSNQRPVLSPVVEVLAKNRAGELTDEQAEELINGLKGLDVRGDYLNDFYRKSVKQQYAVNLSGGNINNKYYLSIGYDKNLNSVVKDQFDRITLNARNSYSLLKSKLEISTGIFFAQVTEKPGFSPSDITSVYPYTRLVDDVGSHLEVPQYRREYIDTAGAGHLLDWKLRPLDEVQFRNNTSKTQDYRVDLGIRYKFLNSFDIDLKYRYGKGLTETRNLYSQETYFTRNLINQFSSINWVNGAVTRPVPLGSILDASTSTYVSHNARLQLNFNKTWNGDHIVNAIAGAAIQDVTTNSLGTRYYGYDDETAISVAVDNVSAFRHYIVGNTIRISNNQSVNGLSSRFVYYFGNASYTFKDRYTINASARKDAANLFGIKSNQKWVPLWSVGASWDISRESFYQLKWLHYLKLRANYGYNGNSNSRITAFLVARQGGTNRYGAPSAFILTPPNEELRWEKVGVLNIGLDYGLFKNRVSGSVEFYRKNGKDLISDILLPPSAGLTSYSGNTGNLQVNGIDLTINGKIVDRSIKWMTSVLFSLAKDKVTKFNLEPKQNSDNVGSLYSIVGKPLSGMYSYKWGGLNENGDPVGFYQGNKSNSYTSIFASTDPNDIVYSGPRTPPYFGSIRNTLMWKQFSLSFNIAYRLGYYFRRASINYAQFFGSTQLGHVDYQDRWQKAGDEAFTNVPAMIYPINTGRETFYTNSEVLVERGDHVRLRDIRIDYTLTRQDIRNLPFRSIVLYVYHYNGGILWSATDRDIDPDWDTTIPPSKSISLGLNIEF